jgi:transposase
MKCPSCGKRMKKIAKSYGFYTHVERNGMPMFIEINKRVYRCLWCGEMKHEV